MARMPAASVTSAWSEAHTATQSQCAHNTTATRTSCRIRFADSGLIHGQHTAATAHRRDHRCGAFDDAAAAPHVRHAAAGSARRRQAQRARDTHSVANCFTSDSDRAAETLMRLGGCPFAVKRLSQQ
jgi:hypothetical protein